MWPGASVSGWYFWRPDARYFGVGRDRARSGRGLRPSQGLGHRDRGALAVARARLREEITMPTLRELIADGRVHVVDGAMGTMLYDKGIFLNTCFDELVVARPGRRQRGARRVRRRRRRADRDQHLRRQPAQAGAVRPGRGRGITERRGGPPGAHAPWVRIASSSARSVRSASDSSRSAHWAATRRKRRSAARWMDCSRAASTASAWRRSPTSTSSKRRLRAVRARSDLAVMAQVTVGPDGRTAYGTAPEAFGPALEAAGADVVGVNCSIGPQVVLEAIERLVRVVRVPVSAQPNAGLPRDVADRKIYMASPEYMAEYARRMVEAGARFVGGCCGTTPAHIKAIRSFVRSAQPAYASRRTPEARAVDGGAAAWPRCRWRNARDSARSSRPASGSRRSKIVPPRGVDPAPMLAQARALKAAGVDAVNIPDGPRAQSRQGALISGLLIEREVGLETVIHYACRDRNLLGMLSDLLGAAAAGLRNLLIVTGDPPKMGPYPDATAVFDIDAIGLTNLVARLNRGLDPGGNPIGAPTRFVHGVGVNPAATDLERELQPVCLEGGSGRAVRHDAAGVRPAAAGGRSCRAQRTFGVPIIAGIWPLVSLRNAEFLANEVPGVTVPPATLVRMRRASERGKEAALSEGVAIAREMLAAVRGAVRGVQVAAPMGKVEVALEVLRQ